MNSRSALVRNIAASFCTWGERNIVPNQNYVGGPVPLLRNPAKGFFKMLVLINMIFTFICVLTFIIQQFTLLSEIETATDTVATLEAADGFDPENPGEEYEAAFSKSQLQTSCVELATAQLYMIIAFLLNTCVMMQFAKTERASDQQWFRIRIFNYICILFQVVSGFINISGMMSQLSLEPELQCEGGWIGVSLTLQSLFIIALILNVISVGLIRVELVTRIHKYFYYRPEPDIAIKY